MFVKYRCRFDFVLDPGRSQLSVFQCRLGHKRQIQPLTKLNEIIDSRQDHLLMLDLGPTYFIIYRERKLRQGVPVRHEPVAV